MKRLLFLASLMAAFTSATTNAQNPQPAMITPENAHQLQVGDVLFRGQVTDAQWTPDGQTLIVAAATGLWLYDAENYGAEPRFLPTANGWIRSLAVSSTGLIATGHDTGTITLWDLEGEIQILEGHQQAVLSVDFSADGSHLASASGYRDCESAQTDEDDSHINIWDTATGELQQSIEPLQVRAFEVSFNSDGRFVGIVGDYACGADVSSPTIQIIDLDNGRNIQMPDSHTKSGFLTYGDAIVFSPDGRWQVTVNGVLSIWNRQIEEIQKLGSNLTEFQYFPGIQVFSPNSRFLYTIAYNQNCHIDGLVYYPNSIVVIDTNTWAPITCFAVDYDFAAIHHHPSQTQLVTIHRDNSVRVWDINTQQELAHLTGFSEAVSALQFSPDGQQLVFRQNENLISLDVDTWEESIILTESIPSLFAFSPDGYNLAYLDTIYLEYDTHHTVSRSILNHTPSIYMIDLQTQEQLWKSEPLNSDDLSYYPWVGFSEDSRQVIYWTTAQQMEFRDTKTGELLRTLVTKEALWNGGVPSPDGRLIAGGRNEQMVLIDTSTGQDVAILPSVYYGGFEILWTTDSKYLLTRSARYDRPEQFLVWDVENRSLAFEHEGQVSYAQLTPDEQLMIYTSGNGGLSFFNTSTWTQLNSVVTSHGMIRAIAIHPNGHLIATATADGTLQLWAVSD